MRIVFMGSPDFAVPSLNALVEAGHDVIAVYSQPPRPAGRGKGERKTAVHERADELGIEVRTPKTLRNEEEQARFRALDADLAVVAAYGLILPKPILDAPRHGAEGREFDPERDGDERDRDEEEELLRVFRGNDEGARC